MIRKKNDSSTRLRAVVVCFFALALWIIAHLFSLQIIEHDYYKLFASNAHEIYKKIHPDRGTVFFQDTRTHTFYPAALNRPYYLIYAVPKEIPAEKVGFVYEQLLDILNIDDSNKKQEILSRLAKKNSWYQVVQKKVDEHTMQELLGAKLPGIYSSIQQYRYYPEEDLGSGVLGFCSQGDNDSMVGKYGVEGYWNDMLAGKAGYVSGEKTGLGSWIAFADRQVVPAENGADVVLTIDRTLQYKACKRLEDGMKEYGAKSSALVILNPKTGAVLAMCSFPDFNPNDFSNVSDLERFNNKTIFTAYEPGSVFKPVVMSAALDAGLISPNTTFTDPCKWELKGSQPIYNAERACYGLQTMTQVLENSVNTGMVWVQKQLGLEQLRTYIKQFGFGKKTGIALSTEVGGNISSLDTYVINGIYASFGQGITVTPLQLAAAYSAFANEGKMPKPYIVEEIRFPNGKIEYPEVKKSVQVISARTAKLITGMLVSVIEKKYFRVAKLDHYYLAGKTGTAQIAVGGGTYQDNAKRTNHTFVGYGPTKTSPYVVVVKYEEPVLTVGQRYAEHTAAPVFRDIMNLLVQYYNIPEER
jgi:cell division protein FtsI/penicillin-binding protein 2